MGTTTHAGTHEATTYSHMVGVFRERTTAEQALNELKQAGFWETELTVYDPHPAEEPVDSSMRVLVHVLAEGREQEAVAILVSHGANNADLPLGTELYHGSIPVHPMRRVRHTRLLQALPRVSLAQRKLRATQVISASPTTRTPRTAKAIPGACAIP
jgi:hypothetical protein